MKENLFSRTLWLSLLGREVVLGGTSHIWSRQVVPASALEWYEFGLPHPGWEVERRETMNLHLGPLPLKVWRREVNQGYE